MSHPDIEYWFSQAKYDLDTAESMLQAGRYLYVLFCCQQAIEKALKALVVQETKGMPPRTHALRELAQLAGVELEEGLARFFAGLEQYYISSRYPEEAIELAGQMDADTPKDCLERTKEVLEWLEAKVK